MKTADGKPLFSNKENPCVRTRHWKLEKTILGMFDEEGLKSSKSFFWKCPIPQGISTIEPRKKQITFSFMVPSFMSSKGAYQWIEVYETKRNGKTETFLTITRPFTVDQV